MTLRVDERKRTVGYWSARILLLFLIAATLFPFFLMFYMSVKEGIMIQIDFWSFPDPIKWQNYLLVFPKIIMPIFTTLWVGFVSVFGTLVLSSLSGYAFGRHDFIGKNAIFVMFIGVMMIPGILTIVPQYVNIIKLGLLGSYASLILPYMAGLQLMGILLTRSFYSSLPEEMFEAARMEGAGETYMFLRIAMPLSWPVLVAIGITSFISIYNDYIWPTLMLTSDKQTFTQAIVVLTSPTGQGGSDYGLITAGYVIGTIPLLIITMFTFRYYVDGIVEGAIKG